MSQTSRQRMCKRDLMNFKNAQKPESALGVFAEALQRLELAERIFVDVAVNAAQPLVIDVVRVRAAVVCGVGSGRKRVNDAFGARWQGLDVCVGAARKRLAQVLGLELHRTRGVKQVWADRMQQAQVTASSDLQAAL